MNRSPDTRNRILTEAEALTRSRGFSGFSYADLSERIGIQKASIHHHFASKEDLGLALISSYRERLLSQMKALLESTPSAQGRLLQYGAVYTEGVKQGLTCLCGMLASEAGILPAPMKAGIKGFFEEHQRWLEQVLVGGKRSGEIRPEIDPAEKATELLSGLQGAMFLARLTEDPGVIERVFSGALRVLWVCHEDKR